MQISRVKEFYVVYMFSVFEPFTARAIVAISFISSELHSPRAGDVTGIGSSLPYDLLQTRTKAGDEEARFQTTCTELVAEP